MNHWVSRKNCCKIDRTVDSDYYLALTTRAVCFGSEKSIYDTLNADINKRNRGTFTVRAHTLSPSEWLLVNKKNCCSTVHFIAVLIFQTVSTHPSIKIVRLNQRSVYNWISIFNHWKSCDRINTLTKYHSKHYLKMKFRQIFISKQFIRRMLFTSISNWRFIVKTWRCFWQTGHKGTVTERLDFNWLPIRSQLCLKCVNAMKMLKPSNVICVSSLEQIGLSMIFHLCQCQRTISNDIWNISSRSIFCRLFGSSKFNWFINHQFNLSRTSEWIRKNLNLWKHALIAINDWNRCKPPTIRSKI